MAATALVWDLIAKDNASRAFLRTAASADKAAASTTRYGAVQKEVAATSSRFSGALASSAKALGALGLTFGAIDIVKQAAQFQQSMLLIKTNANASTGELNRMTKAVLALSPQVAASPNDLANALYHVEQNGLRGAKALEALKVGAEGAKIGMADVEDTTNTMTIAIASGMHGVNNLQKAMGAMIAAAGTGDMRLSQLNEALGTGILSVAKGFGASMKDVAAILATLGDNGIRGVNAAQGLRQVMMGFAAPAKRGEDALKSIGLTMNSLGAEMSKHGLVAAMNLLDQRMKAAGITGGKVGAFITNAFGRRAGASLGVLMGEMTRVNTKFDEVGKGAESFGRKWQDTTHTTAFALDKLKATVESAGISFAQKLMPGMTAAANFLSTTLPAAVSTLWHAVQPLAQTVGHVLVGAWHALVAVLKPVGAALASVGHFLANNAGLVKTVGTTVLAMWAAFKGVAIATVAVRAIDTALLGLSRRAEMAAASMASVRTSGIALSGGAATAGIVAFGFAVHAAGMAISNWIEGGRTAGKVAQQLAGDTESWKQALVQTNGVLTENTRLQIGQQLQSSGLADKAAKAGISLNQLIDGVTGNNSAMQALIKTWKASGAPASDTIFALELMHKAYSTAATGAKQLLQAQRAHAAQQKIGNAIGRVGTTVTNAFGDAFGGAAKKIKASTTAAQAAKAAMKALSGDLKDAALYASATGSAFLDAVQTFQKDGVGAASRAALIGATLKAANGDALNFVTQMNAGAAAAHQFAADIRQTAKGIGKNGESTKSFLDSIINLKKGTIDYKNAAAAPLINALNSIQSSAMNAAQAEFQHARGTMSAKDAADHAYHIYKNQTQGALIDEAHKLGLTKDQAKKLADQYFGMPKKVKTLIEQEGANPIVTILKQIRNMLGVLTGHPWTPKVTLDWGAANHGLDSLATKIHGIVDKTYNVSVGVVESNGVRHGGNAATGGQIHGPGTGTSDSIPIRVSNGEFVVRAAQAQKHLGLLHAINNGARGYANGGEVTKAGGNWYYNGISYSTRQAAENARQRDISGSATSHASSAITNISTAKTGFMFAKLMQQMTAASKALKEAIAAGASKAQIRSLTDRLNKAEREGKRQERLLGKSIANQAGGLGGLVGQMNPNKVASRSDVASSLHGLEASLRQAGLSKQFIKSLGDENKQILNDVSARNKAAIGVAKANAALVAAQKRLHDDEKAFKAASVSSFDITTAGVNANGRVSKGSLRAAQVQDLTRVREWVAGMKKLARKHIFPAAYLRQLAGKGPDALATVKALLSMSGTELKDFAQTQQQISRLSGQESRVVAHRLDQGRINRDREREKKAREREKRAQKHLEVELNKLAEKFDHALKHGHFDGDLHFKSDELAKVVLSGEKKAKSRRGGSK